MAGPEREIFVVAGEPSGDTHAGGVLRALREIAPEIKARGLGGPKMAAAGFELLHDLASDAVMGLFPVIRALPRLRRLFHEAVHDLTTRRPAALLLVDYPGFNIRLASAAKRIGVPVIYYISPQVWAWAPGRARKLARLVDLMLVILPFEEEVYRGTNLRTVYVGHPMSDHLRSTPPDPHLVAQIRGDGPPPLVGVFPGSRRHVVESLLPVFAEAALRLRAMPGTENARFALALAQESFRPIAARVLRKEFTASIHVGRPNEVREASDLCLTSSGTTTLEIAAGLRPFVIGYKVSPLLYAIGRLVVSVPHIGLVNLVAGGDLIPEHVGWRSFAAACARDLHRLWTDPAAREAQIRGLKEVRTKLETEGSYRRAASEIARFLGAGPRI